MIGIILDGGIHVGSFSYIQGEDYSKLKMTDVELQTIYIDLNSNRSQKLRFMITSKNEDGSFRLIKDLGMGCVEGGTFINDKMSYFRDVRFVPFNKNSELN